MEPATLVEIINNPLLKKPLIYSIGPGGDIKGSIEMGDAREKKNLDRFKETLSKLDRNSDIVIFCGCCPFVD